MDPHGAETSPSKKLQRNSETDPKLLQLASPGEGRKNPAQEFLHVHFSYLILPCFLT